MKRSREVPAAEQEEYGQERLNFDPQKPAEMPKAWTTTPHEFFRKFLRGCDSIGLIRLAGHVLDNTLGGQFDPRIYGRETEGFNKKNLRPNCVPLTGAEMEEITGQTESGVAKVVALGQSLGVVRSERKFGKLWYFIDWDSVSKMEASEPRKVAPKPETTNIPHDIPHGMPMVTVPGSSEAIPLSAACPSGEACCLVAKYSGPPCSGNAGLVEKITTCMTESAEQGRFIPANLQPITAKSLREAIDKVQFRRGGIDYNQLPVEAISLTGRTLDITLAPSPGARSQDWLVNQRDHDLIAEEVVRASGASSPNPSSGHSGNVVGNVVGNSGVEAADRLTLADITRKLNERLRPKFGSKVPPSVANGVYQLIQTEAAWSCLNACISRRQNHIKSWNVLIKGPEGKGIAHEAAEAYADELAAFPPPAPRNHREPRWANEGMWAADKAHWDELSAEQKDFYRGMFEDAPRNDLSRKAALPVARDNRTGG
jgi:hypothetical protein